MPQKLIDRLWKLSGYEEIQGRPPRNIILELFEVVCEEVEMLKSEVETLKDELERKEDKKTADKQTS